MEDALGAKPWKSVGILTPVLILVLMEDALGEVTLTYHLK